MRILQLVTKLQRRGAEVFACQLSDELAGRGHDVCLAGLYGDAGALAPERARLVELGGRKRPLVSPALLGRLADLLHGERFDLVQANGSDTLAYAALARRRLRAKWPLVYRNIGMPSAWSRRPGRRAWIRLHLRQVARVASVSEASARDFAGAYGFPRERLVTIPRGVVCPETGSREERRARLAAAAGVEADAPLLVHVGSMTPEKNHAWLVAAFARVAAREPAARLVLVGEGPGAAGVREAAARAGVADRVRLTGMRPDADDLAGGADAFLLPSLTEGLPGVVLEAAAREVPAVACDVGGAAEAIVDGETGYLVPSGDLDGFVDRTLLLLADPARARAMGRAARARVCARFALPRVADAFENLYRELVPCAARTASST